AKQRAQSQNETLLVERYGAEAFEMLQNFGESKTYWQLEAHQAIHHTMCLNLVDFFTRRVPLMLSHSDHGLSLLDEVSEVFKLELQWSEAQLSQQKQALHQYIDAELAWRNKILIG